MLHSWRDRAVDVFAAWVRVDAVRAVTCAKKVPPRPLVGRWGSASDCQRFLLRATSSDVNRIVVPVLSASSTTRKAPSKPLGTQELNVEEIAIHSERMGRWRNDAITALRDERFWICLALTDKLMSPLSHFYNWLMANQDQGRDLPGDGSQLPYTNLALLVWGKAEELRAEVETLMESQTWDELTSVAPPEHLDNLRAAIRIGSMKVLCGFDWRVMQRVSALPMRLLLFGAEPSNYACPRRQQLASDLLATPDDQLHATARNVKLLFRTSLEFTAATGQIYTPLFVIWRIAAQMWSGDSQEIEGVNNMIKSITTMAPGISLSLLDARVSTRKDAGIGSRSRKVTRWRQVSQRAEEMIADAVDHVSGVNKILASKDRWALPDVATIPGTDIEERVKKTLTPLHGHFLLLRGH